MVCLDTTVLVDFLRGREEAVKLLSKLLGSSEAVTMAAPTVFELVEGAEIARSEMEKREIREFLSSITVLSLDAEAAWTAGEISGSLVLSGNQIGQMDTLIGAIALAHGERLITRNVGHFSRIPSLQIEDYRGGTRRTH